MIDGIKSWILKWLTPTGVEDPCTHSWGKWKAHIIYQRRKCLKCGYAQSELL